MVFDPRSKDALIIVCPNFFFTIVSNTLPQKSGDIIWLYRVDCCADDFIEYFTPREPVISI